MDLFEQAYQERLDKGAPLAARMRPRTLDEFIGQEAIVGPGRLLRRAIQADQLSSLIFYGPPGTGKTTLAQVIANTTRAHFTAINAVLAGVKEIREAVAGARDRLALHGQRTILFVDEVHRFNKAQQDALLPWVENGTVILIGATTENPYFEVNKALVSRSRIFQLKPLEAGHLRAVARYALADRQRGYGDLDVVLDEDALAHLVNVANGDARALLNALELAVETTPPQTVGGSARVHVTLAIAEESIQRRAVLYDKEGDYHFDTISAFIKSLRGSDPDAAMYWMAKMLYAGEDPRFILRRMIIFAGEDVGLADPGAVQVVMACAEAFDRIGMPEGRFPLSQAALYLSTAPKSNSAFALFDALRMVEQETEGEVPNHLRDASRDQQGFGHGEGYLYPHAYRDHWVAQQYLPAAMQGRVFYQPSDQGYEGDIQARVARHREAQLAAMVDAGTEVHLESLTYSPDDPARERWLQRTVSGAGDRLAALRDRLFALVRLSRHSVVLDANAGSGLLTWEALRRVPEGGVYALAETEQDALALREQADQLATVERPIILQGRPDQVEELLAGLDQGEMVFDAILGRNVLLLPPDKAATVCALYGRLAAGGTLALAERIPRHTQRLYRLLDWTQVTGTLAERVRSAEEAIYVNSRDPMVNWDERTLEEDLRRILTGTLPSGALRVEVEDEGQDLQVSERMLARWFGEPQGDRPSYGQHLAAELDGDEIQQVHALFRSQITNRIVRWHARVAYVVLRRPAG
jgi:putative ATPase